MKLTKTMEVFNPDLEGQIVMVKGIKSGKRYGSPEKFSVNGIIKLVKRDEIIIRPFDSRVDEYFNLKTFKGENENFHQIQMFILSPTDELKMEGGNENE